MSRSVATSRSGSAKASGSAITRPVRIQYRDVGGASIPYPLELTPGVAYLAAIDPWVIDNAWSLSEGKPEQIMLPQYVQPTRDAAGAMFEDGGFGSVLLCSDGVWRCWYMTQMALGGASGTKREAVGIATSSDGTTWTIPDLETYPDDVTVSGTNNIVFRGHTDFFAAGVSVIHAPPNASGFVYYMVYRTSGGVWLVGTTDVTGVTWDDSSARKIHGLTVDSNFVIVPAPDEDDGWILMVRGEVWGGPGGVVDKGNQRRLAVVRLPSLESESAEPVQVVLRPDAEDVLAGEWGFLYSSSLAQHESGLYLALLHLFRLNDDISPSLAWSRDCLNWHRPAVRHESAIVDDEIVRTPVQTLDLAESGWDSGMIFPVSGVYVEEGDEWHMYYAGWDGEHGELARRPGEEPGTADRREVATGRATWRKEGVACWRGPLEGGVVCSRPIRWGSSGLFLNAAPMGGSIQVRVMTESRRDPANTATYGPIEGFAFADCDAIADGTRTEVTWGDSDIRDLSGSTVRVEVYLDGGAELYAMGAL